MPNSEKSTEALVHGESARSRSNIRGRGESSSAPSDSKPISATESRSPSRASRFPGARRVCNGYLAQRVDKRLPNEILLAASLRAG